MNELILASHDELEEVVVEEVEVALCVDKLSIKLFLKIVYI